MFLTPKIHFRVSQNFPLSSEILIRASPFNYHAFLKTTWQEQFSRCVQTFRYRKLLFALAWFHAILLERRKFKSLGFNVPYEFNESDFSICHDLVIVFLDEVSLEALSIQ